MSSLKKYVSFQYPRGCTLRMLAVLLSDVYHNFRKNTVVIKKDKCLIKSFFRRLAEGSLRMNYRNVVLIIKNYLFHHN